MAARLTAKVGGHTLVFRLPDSVETAAHLEALKVTPDDGLEASHALCERLLVSGEWAEVAEQYPLSVDQIVPQLFQAASDEARRQVQAAVRRWKTAETNLGRIAENLLAFKAYNGGDASEKAFAGALHVAEWFDSTRGLFRLCHGYMKGLRRRG